MRLRTHCEKTAQVKRKAFIEDLYWGKPVLGFGDKNAQFIIVGLAPAAHGANRTGRMFTGDQSGKWLYRGLYKARFSNQMESLHQHDRLKLKGVFITAAARCAPPKNKLTPKELKNCSTYLAWEIENLKNVKIFLALGKIAFDALWVLLKEKGLTQGKKPKFQHGVQIPLVQNKYLLTSYHPSQQNTFTGKLTEPMFDKVFETARMLLQNRF